MNLIQYSSHIIFKANIMKIGKTTAQLAHIQLREHASLNKSDTYATMTPRGEWWFKIIPYKIGFESSLTFIFTKLWAQFLVNGKEWWLTRLTPNSANDATWPGTLGFSNELRERKLRRENPKKIYMDYWKIRNTRATRCRPTRDNIPLWPVHNKPFQLNTHEISGVLRTFFHPNLCPQIRDRPGHRAGLPRD